MTVTDICKNIRAEVVCGDTAKQFDGVYVGDLLSRAMSHVQSDCLWVTIMSNANVIAVATLTEPAAVVLAEDVELQEDALKAAQQNAVTVLRSPLSAYDICAAICKEIGA